MDRVSLVKIVTPDPEAVDRFLREVVDVPEGWPIGGYPPPKNTPVSPPSPARDANGDFTLEAVHAFRGDSGEGGLVTGSTQSRQFQILKGEHAHIWAVAIGTRDLEAAYKRCVEQGYPCTEPKLIAWGDAGMRYFYVEVAGVVFEVMRAEDEGPPQ
jgi:Glyoxalase/Bleomycin resistance protein/Dioxygenase superfamily